MAHRNPIILIIITLILLTTTINPALSYHANIIIHLHKDGSVTINGNTDYPPLQNIINSQNFTSKKGEYWIFNLTTKHPLQNYSYLLIMPDNVIINYIKTTPNIKIITGAHFEIKGHDKNKRLVLIVQYKFINTVADYLTYIGLGLISILMLSGLLLYKKRKNKKEKNTIQEKLNTKGLTERQKEILFLIAKEKKISQKNISIKLNIPKSSVSRNINILLAKKLIKKEKVGQTTYISLEPESSEGSA